MRYPFMRGDMKQSLAGLRMQNEYFDLLEVDTSFSLDEKSFEGRGVLRSTYHTAFLERGLASLPPALPTPEPLEPAAEARARRAATAGQAGQCP